MVEGGNLFQMLGPVLPTQEIGNLLKRKRAIKMIKLGDHCCWKFKTKFSSIYHSCLGERKRSLDREQKSSHL